MKPIIKVENLSKQYQLGTIGTGTFAHDVNRWWYSVRGKEDPYSQLGEVNDRASKGNSKYVWALKDINFEVMPGEVLGIIGKNGAGKSTLLKILSRVTGPTTGNIEARGRIASLLEVGTGFHPELTGRENVYLNGAILGMTKSEIRSKLDEIVEFSGCERYLETPVKRYSSGMKVRLAFAVAAHLEPEILIVDEVLAVGDAEFQKKAIGKMQDVSAQDGRTVLFVSHSMNAIKNLCNRIMIIENGTSGYSGGVEEGIARYLRSNSSEIVGGLRDRRDRRGNGSLKFTEIQFFTSNNRKIYDLISGEEIIIKIHYELLRPVFHSYFRIQILDSYGRILFILNNEHSHKRVEKIDRSGFITCTIPSFPLLQGEYSLNLRCMTDNGLADEVESAVSFSVVDGDFFKTGKVPGIKEGVLVSHYWNE